MPNAQSNLISPRRPVAPHLRRAITYAAAASIAASLLAPAPAAAHPHVWVGTKTTFQFDNGALTALRFTWLFDEMYTTSAIDGLDKNNDGKLDQSELEELTKVNIDGLKEFDFFTSARIGNDTVGFNPPRDYLMEVVEVDEGPGPQLVAAPQPAATAEQKPATQSPKGFWSRIGGWFTGLFAKSPKPESEAKAPVPQDKVKVLALHMTLPLKAPISAEALKNPSSRFQYTLTDNQMYIWFEPMPKDGIALGAGAPAGCSYAVVEPEPDEEQKKLAEAFGRAGSTSISTPGKPVELTCAGK